jgi:hypothetical protein
MSRERLSLYSRLFMAIQASSLVWAINANDLHAEYNYISADPYAVHRKLVVDIESQQVDRSNLSEKAEQAIRVETPFSATPARLRQIGSLKEVCLTLAFRYQNGRKLIFRTLHQNGCGDWVIAASAVPEVVQYIIFAPRPMAREETKTCGPPVILPPPNSSESVLLPPRVTCADVDTVIQPSTDAAEVCNRVPDLCRRQP